MACVNPDGRPTESGTKMLLAMKNQARTPEEAATDTGLPVFRVRSGLRELEAAGLALSTPEGYRATDKGAALISTS